MTEKEWQIICNTLSAQRNKALDEVAMRDAQIAALTERLDELARTTKPAPAAQQELFPDAEERN